MSPVISSQPHEEPTIPVLIQDREHSFMVNTGATYSCIGKDGSGLPLSNASIKTVGFSGKSQVIPLTQPVPMLIAGKTVLAPLLYSANTPINLLGRDILCPLKAKNMCTQDGLYLDFPDNSHVGMMPAVAQPDSTERLQPMVHWLKLIPDESHLKQAWEPWIRMKIGAAETPTLPLRCTMMFDADQSHVDYAHCWDELINSKPFLLESEDIYLGPQGAAAAVKLPDDLRDWVQVSNSTPHVTLLIAQGHESHELGPMVKAAKEVTQWTPTDNKFIHVSAEQLIRICPCMFSFVQVIVISGKD